MPTSLPATMTVMEITEPGGPEVLKPAQQPLPAPGTGETLIKVHAAGVNRPDLLQRAGSYPPPPGASPLPGLEIAGEIAALGNDVTGWAIGDKVVALTNGGGYAEYATVPAGQILPLPEGYTLAEGAALPETLFTVQQTLIDRAGLRKGQTVLIHGGAGGIGGAAIALSRLKGAIPFVTVSTADKADYARSIGAEGAINYRDEDFVERIKDMTDGKGPDVILDIIGGEYAGRNLMALAEDGTIIQFAALTGKSDNVHPGLLVRKRATWFGSTLRAQPDKVKAAIADHLRAEVWPALEQGKLPKPEIRSFPLTEAAAAHQAMDAPGHAGKIVLLVADGT
ncbi:zinc-binding dehydrogenase [Cucumibacter marinus]|uniref:zinc-binding dehydrogenase n=1 Tax=Cucumibacter marinus TaxID=1121252 RepID=UPI000407659A|nr:zinc-binding dehydrogenase [Cucumibacter marinus]